MGSTKRNEDIGRGACTSPSQNSVPVRLLKESLGLRCAQRNSSVGIRGSRAAWGLHLAWEGHRKLLLGRICDSTRGKEGHLLHSAEGLKSCSWPLGESFCTVSCLPESSQGLCSLCVHDGIVTARVAVPVCCALATCTAAVVACHAAGAAEHTVVHPHWHKSHWPVSLM